MEFINFEKKHIAQASHLLVEQFARILDEIPHLPQRITDEDVARDFLAHLCKQDDCHGVAMLEGDHMMGYLLGTYGDNPFFGQHSYVPFGGIALSEKIDIDALVRLYTALGERWMKDEVLNHYLVLPALPDWLDTAFSLSFGKEQAYAAAPMTDLLPPRGLPEGIVMREVLPTDAAGLHDSADWIAGHYNLAPVWEPVPAVHLSEVRKGYAELANEEESTTWIALDGERIVSFMVIYPEDIGPSSLFGEEGVTHFAVAATHTAYRGQGIGRALFTHVMNLAVEQGTKIMTTDWRTTNSAAAQYWPSFGFQPYAYRVLRRTNPRYQIYNSQMCSGCT